MKLDKRIISGKKPLTCFDIDKAEQFIGKKGYFSDYLSVYTDIRNMNEYVLQSLDEHNLDKHHDETYIASHVKWKFFLPAEWVKPEKKYRPYTVMEFIKYYPIGSHLHLRLKGKTIEMHRLIDGYDDCKDGSGTLFICGVMYSMSELYDDYEIFNDGEWQPFGVIDEDKE